MYLSVRDLTLAIEGKELLHSVSFDAEEGTITVIAGRNGSGKSLLLKCLKGLEKPQAGSITLEGRALSGRKERMAAFGLVFQDPSLQTVGSTVEKDIAFGPENMGLPRERIREIVDSMCSRFSLDRIRRERPEVLSGGEKRRLAIAGVLAMDAKVLLLDEPFANLDYPSTLMMIETLIELRESGQTVIIVSHEAEKFLRHTDRTIIMADGRIAADGRSSDVMPLLKGNGIYIPDGARIEDLSWLA